MTLPSSSGDQCSLRATPSTRSLVGICWVPSQPIEIYPTEAVGRSNN